jgi:uncharacterized protein YdaU (DUF1376 family)
MNFYKRHIGDYLKDTAHLSLLEHGVYTRLLDVYYTRESGIPDAQAARLIGARNKDECAALKVVLGEFFELYEGMWVQHRCEREIEDASAQAKANRENGKKGGRPKKNENPNETEVETELKPNGNPLGSDSLSEKNLSQTPDSRLHKNTTRVPRFDAQAHLESMGVESVVARDWLALRKGKRLTPTETAFDGVKAEADKAGLDMNDVIRTCCTRGWAGFKAEWLERPVGRMNGHSDNNPFA